MRSQSARLTSVPGLRKLTLPVCTRRCQRDLLREFRNVSFRDGFPVSTSEFRLLTAISRFTRRGRGGSSAAITQYIVRGRQEETSAGKFLDSRGPRERPTHAASSRRGLRGSAQAVRFASQVLGRERWRTLITCAMNTDYASEFFGLRRADLFSGYM